MSHRIMTGWLKIGATLGAVVLIAACSSSEPAAKANVAAPPKTSQNAPGPGTPTNGLVQTSNGGGVTVAVEWQGIKDGQLIFSVTLDTHSGSVDQYDLAKLAVLRDSAGTEYRATKWDSSPGGHHRKGTLTFPASAIDTARTKSVVMVIRDTAGVKERDLRWQFS